MDTVGAGNFDVICRTKAIIATLKKEEKHITGIMSLTDHRTSVLSIMKLWSSGSPYKKLSLLLSDALKLIRNT